MKQYPPLKSSMAIAVRRSLLSIIVLTILSTRVVAAEQELSNLGDRENQPCITISVHNTPTRREKQSLLKVTGGVEAEGEFRDSKDVREHAKHSAEERAVHTPVVGLDDAHQLQDADRVLGSLPNDLQSTTGRKVTPLGTPIGGLPSNLPLVEPTSEPSFTLPGSKLATSQRAEAASSRRLVDSEEPRKATTQIVKDKPLSSLPLGMIVERSKFGFCFLDYEGERYLNRGREEELDSLAVTTPSSPAARGRVHSSTTSTTQSGIGASMPGGRKASRNDRKHSSNTITSRYALSPKQSVHTDMHSAYPSATITASSDVSPKVVSYARRPISHHASSHSTSTSVVVNAKYVNRVDFAARSSRQIEELLKENDPSERVADKRISHLGKKLGLPLQEANRRSAQNPNQMNTTTIFEFDTPEESDNWEDKEEEEERSSDSSNCCCRCLWL